MRRNLMALNGASIKLNLLVKNVVKLILFSFSKRSVLSLSLLEQNVECGAFTHCGGGKDYCSVRLGEMVWQFVVVLGW
jgi:hypothetical protein